ncbi:hypothetical protein [Rivihabitans pingtungensis]|uniref:hypothetical protein n=1 Tax=Rivihabitans pingtungensis TaxID=1054498 RepID=UPI0023F1DEE4|nr:hypothetical protein [Rivihabitans pingtungensis]
MSIRERLVPALQAALVHLGGSVLVAGLSAALVFGLWFPAPYAELAGGLFLWALIAVVDVVCGPILTLVLYSPTKPRAKWLLDIGLILLVQLSALVYGLHSIALTRPVWLAFEGDRLRIVKAVEVHGQYLPQAQPGLTALPWTGPRLIAVGRWTNQTQHFWKVCSVLCRGILRRSTRNAGLLTSNAPKRCANCSILWPHWKIAPVWRLCGS